MKAGLFAFVSGAVFSVGLSVGGMTQPQKVIAFLDFTGAWDPSLALVMGAALAVYVPAYLLIRRRRSRPVLATHFALPPPPRKVDAKLIGGAALFGIGWGVAGFCPGPAIASLAGLAPAALVFAPAMLLGAVGTRWAMRRRTETAEASVVARAQETT